MPATLRRSLPITVVAAVLTGAPAVAQTHTTPAPRVRPVNTEAQALVDDLALRSPTARALLDALAASDVVVYVRHQRFTETTLEGRTGFVRSNAPTRILIVELACGRTWAEQLVTLAHELRHAVEIAGAEDVDGPRALADHFARIGFRADARTDVAHFETAGALAVAATVRKELAGQTGRTTTHDARH